MGKYLHVIALKQFENGSFLMRNKIMNYEMLSCYSNCNNHYKIGKII